MTDREPRRWDGDELDHRDRYAMDVEHNFADAPNGAGAVDAYATLVSERAAVGGEVGGEEMFRRAKPEVEVVAHAPAVIEVDVEPPPTPRRAPRKRRAPKTSA